MTTKFTLCNASSSLSICLSIPTSVYLSAWLSLYELLYVACVIPLSTRVLSICLLIYISMYIVGCYPSIYMSACLSIYQGTRLHSRSSSTQQRTPNTPQTHSWRFPLERSRSRIEQFPGQYTCFQLDDRCVSRPTKTETKALPYMPAPTTRKHRKKTINLF